MIVKVNKENYVNYFINLRELHIYSETDGRFNITIECPVCLGVRFENIGENKFICEFCLDDVKFNPPIKVRMPVRANNMFYAGPAKPLGLHYSGRKAAKSKRVK